MYQAETITDYIIHNFIGIQNLALQKILYFIQAEFLVTKNRPCFHDPIQAWDFGPVVPNIYLKYRFYGNGCIPKPKNGYNNTITKKDAKIINNVVKTCMKYSNAQLTIIIQHQDPWTQNYEPGKRNVIPNQKIRDYFKNNKK